MRYTVTIQADANGNMTYLPALLRANPGDTVEWRCADGAVAQVARRAVGRPFGLIHIHAPLDVRRFIGNS